MEAWEAVAMDDEKLEQALAWRRVRARAELGGFNGLVVTDLTAARMAIEHLLEAAPNGWSIDRQVEEQLEREKAS